MHPASLDVEPSSADRISPTDNLFQSRLWAGFRRSHGTDVRVVRLGPDLRRMMVQLEQQGDFPLAYVAAGPDVAVPHDEQGRFLERLSDQLRPYLPNDPIAVRYDLPWESPYADVSSRPSLRSREIRMNFGTQTHRLHKAPTDRLAPDTVEIDLTAPEQELLGAMRPKTRYNIRLAARRGVSIHRSDLERVRHWHRLYEQTAARKGFRPQTLDYFLSLFTLARAHRPDVRLYLAYGPDTSGGVVREGALLLGGIVVVHTGTTATYLYGASAAEHRGLMAPHALQWHAIREARRAGCARYDLFGVPPAPDEGHPMHGLYRFKTGFGGRLVHRRGAWDYVYEPEPYSLLEAAEATGRGYYA